MTLPIPYRRAVERIRRRIESGDNFFIVCVGSATALNESVVKALGEQTVRVVEFHEDDMPWEEIAREPATVAVGTFPNDELLYSVLPRLNLGREQLSRSKARVLLWVRLRDLEAFIRAVPDLWSYRSEVLHFVSRHDFTGIEPTIMQHDGSKTYLEKFAENQRTLRWATGAYRAGVLTEQASIAMALGQMELADALLAEAVPDTARNTALYLRYAATRVQTLSRLERWAELDALVQDVKEKPPTANQQWVLLEARNNLAWHRRNVREEKEIVSEFARLCDEVDFEDGFAPSSSNAGSLLNFAGNLVQIGHLSQALAQVETAQQIIEKKATNDHNRAASFLAETRANIALERARPLDALRELHHCATLRAERGLLGPLAHAFRKAASVYKLLGLPNDAQWLGDAAQQTLTKLESATAPLQAASTMLASSEKAPLKTEIDRAIDAADNCQTNRDFDGLRTLSSQAEKLWVSDDPEFRSLFQYARIAFVRAAILVHDEKHGDAIQLLRACNDQLAAATLHKLRIGILLKIALVPTEEASLLTLRKEAAIEALEIAFGAGFIEFEREAIASLVAITSALNQRTESAAYQRRLDALAPTNDEAASLPSPPHAR